MVRDKRGPMNVRWTQKLIGQASIGMAKGRTSISDDQNYMGA